MLKVEELFKTFPGTGSGFRKTLRRSRSRPGQAAVRAVQGVSFEVEEGELFSLLGPSGCGKTTALRSIGGIERPDSGRITLAGRVLFDDKSSINIGPNFRGIGMVFQSYAIWPHMSVFRNVAFPLEVLNRGRKPNRTEIKKRVGDVLDMMELGPFADRSATALSGGQQQRLALARALVTEPPLMLLDEPLSNLDAKLRDTVRLELKRLQRELGFTSVYVTHDQTEALVLSSRIAVMHDGKIVQTGRPREIYTRPATRFVADFVGVSNCIPGTIVHKTTADTQVKTEAGVVVSSRDDIGHTGSEVMVSLRPESLAISLDRSADPIANEWEGRVLTRAYLGESAEHLVRVGGLELQVRSGPNVTFAPETDVFVTIDPGDVIVVP